MRIGVSTACFYMRYFVEDALAEIKRLGFETTECFFSTRSEYLPPLITDIAAAAKGLDVWSAHAMCTQFEPQLLSPNPRQRADALGVLEEFLSAARSVGATHYTFHGPLKLKKKQYFYNYEAIAEALNEVCALSRRYGLRVCYENVHYSFFNCPDYFARLKDLCPDLGAVLDIKQAAQSGYDFEAYLDSMADRLCTVHLCDLKEGMTCLPGRGGVDFTRLFDRLKAMKFDGVSLLEVYPEDYRNTEELVEVINWLENLSN